MAPRRSAMDRDAPQAPLRPTPTAPPRSAMPAVAPPAPLPGHGDEPDAQTAGHGLTRVLSFRSPSGRRDQMTAFIGRREFITLLGGAAAAWPLVANAQQPAMPVVGFLRSGTLTDVPHSRMTAFREGLKEAGFVEGQNVAIEYRWDQTDRSTVLVADLLRQQVAVIVGNTPAALAAKAATTTVPIVFVTGGDPVRYGLVTSLNRPSGNVTGISFISAELGSKQLGLLRELRPVAARIAVLVDPKWPLTEGFVSQLRAAALAVGQQLIVLDVSSDREIETAFTTLVQRGAGALHVGIGGFMISQRERIVALASRHALPTIS